MRFVILQLITQERDMSELNNIAELVLSAAAKWPSKIALFDGLEGICYAKLQDRITSHAHYIGDLGLDSGSRIAVVIDKSVECVAFLFGCLLAGAVVVPINPRLKRRQVEHILIDSGSVLLAVLEGRQSFHEDIRTQGLVCLRPAAEPVVHVAPNSREMRGHSENFSVVSEDIAVLFYTSGSTGMPKAVMCRHSNLQSGALSVNSYIGNTENDRILAILPLSFDAGFSQLTTGFLSGATIVLKDYILPADISHICETYRVTGITGVPPIWKAALAARWSESARLRLRYFANTGGHLTKAHLDGLRSLFPAAKPFLMYGLTEAFRSTYLEPAFVDSRPDSIGKAIPGARVVVVDGSGEECAPGEVGELVHSGPTVAAGYWKSPSMTALRFRTPPPCLQRAGVTNMVVYSGDLCRRDAEGFLYFVSRADKQIKILGNRVSLAEIENTVMLVAEVTACAVSAMPSTDGADPIIIVFYTSCTEFDIESRVYAWCCRELPSFMLPDALVWRDQLLLNPNGKYDLDAMLADYRQHVSEVV